MFSKSVVRSRKTIIKGLLTRAFERGGAEEQEKMQLLIDWRLAACNHLNNQALRRFDDTYKASDMRGMVSTGSRGLDAFNWLSIIEGRNDTLTDAAFEKRIKDMEHMHYWSRFFKNSKIEVDLEALAKVAFLSDPKSPILFDLPKTQPIQRSAHDVVHIKSAIEPNYMRPLDSRGDEIGNTPVEPLRFNKPKFH